MGTRWPRKGDRMRFLGTGGYDHQIAAALKEFAVGQVMTVEDCHVGDWEHSIKFVGIDGRWNGVMFERVEKSNVSAEPVKRRTRERGWTQARSPKGWTTK